MLKLNAGFSRKVGEPNYGSRGAAVSIELELEGTLISAPEALKERIRKLFLLARDSVDAELSAGARTDCRERAEISTPSAAQSGNGQPPCGNHGATAPGAAPAAGGNGHGTAGPNGARLATGAQQRAIRAICQTLGRSAERVGHEHYGVARLDELTRAEASALIDELKETPTPTSRSAGAP